MSGPADTGSGTAWKNNLFGCGGNAIMCIWSWCVPCGFHCMQCVDANHVLGEGTGIKAFFCAWCLCCIGAGFNRKEIREELKIEGTFLMDCLMEWCCGCCAVTQEWQEAMEKSYKDPKKAIWRVFKGTKDKPQS